MRPAAFLLLASAASPAMAQHAGHEAHSPPGEADQSASQHPHGHEGPAHDANERADDAPADQSTMDGMDHSQMDHSGMEHDAAPIPEGAPPAAAGSGPPRAADAVWGAEAMRASRDHLRHEHGNQTYLWFQADRAEYRAREDADGYLWDVQGWYGGDLDKLWLKSEGEGSFGEPIEGAEVQALYSRAIGPWFDFQAGVRQDFAPRDRTYAVVGVQGLAPYLFEIDAAAFLSDRGDLTARVEAELDQRITQRLILQPRAEANLSAQDIPELGIGAGFDSIELGLRLRYEIVPEFAPYIGVEQEWKLGRSADFARLEGENAGVTNYVVGVRFWF
ncbi:copper resistance protein B [Pelagerythrobacter sp.]|uniref:copper resistance protein B n=1 Tax=Pelagerythrobacter sp. TaxID=2800702 RepID=UPI0035B22855